MSVTILYRDERVIVLDKPSGIPVHPGPRGGASVEDHFPDLQFGRRDGPWLAHRLDTDTSGCLVLARRKAAMKELQTLFAENRVRKTYWAVVRGVPAQTSGTIDAPLLKHSTAKSGWRMIVDPAGKTARTAWRVMGQADGISWLELSPKTGRTHQIRVHCAHIGHPILGDPVYGVADTRLHLMARAIDLPLEPPVSVTAPPPAHMHDALLRCGWVSP